MCEISVVIPYYNSEKTILRALNSVINQTYRDFEIILIDDGSVDNTHRIVENFISNNSNYKFIHIYQVNSGPSKARNIGIKSCNGKYIALLDSDDEWLPEKLQKQISVLKKYNADMIGCNYNLILKGKVIKKYIVKKYLKKISFFKCLFKHYFTSSTIVFSKKAILDIGLFPENQKYMEDAYVFKLINRKYDAYVLKDNLVNFYKHLYGDCGLSMKLKDMEIHELNNFKSFRKKNNEYNKKINFLLYSCVIIFSYLKYLRRLLIVKLRRKSD